MAEFYIEIYSNDKNKSLYNRFAENDFFIEKYFFSTVNDKKNHSIMLIDKFKLNHIAIKSKNKKQIIKLTDFYAFPFLFMQKLIDSMDGKDFILGKINITNYSW